MAHSAACQVSSAVLYYYFNSISRYEDVELVSSSLSQKWITASLSLQQCNVPPQSNILHSAGCRQGKLVVVRVDGAVATTETLLVASSRLR